MRFRLFAAVTFISLGILAGCGGSQPSVSSTAPPATTPPPPTQPPATAPTPKKFAIWQTTGGASLAKSSSNAGFNPITAAAFWMLTAGSNASTPSGSGSIVMSFNGFCNTLPDPAKYASLMPANGSFNVLIYGFGRYDSQACENNFQIYNGEAIDPSSGVPVIGDGTLTTLRAYSGVPGSGSASGTIHIYVNGAPTSLTCSLGTGNRCGDDTDTVTVHDNDVIAATVQLLPGDRLNQLRVVLGKQ